MRVREIPSAGDGSGMRIGIAASTFNSVVGDALLDGALAALEEAGVAEVTVMRVPGALELPLAAKRLAESGMDAVVAVGAVIEGETDHYQHVAAQSAAGLREVALTTGVPVANAVLTVREFSQARERSLPGRSNKGFEAAAAAVLTVNSLRAVD